MLLVGDADTGAERVDDAIDHLGCRAATEGSGCERQGILLVSEHLRRDVGQLEGAIVVSVDEPGRGLPEQPLPKEAFVASGDGGQFVAVDRPETGHRLVEPETVTEVNEHGYLLAHPVVPHAEAELLEIVR